MVKSKHIVLLLLFIVKLGSGCQKEPETYIPEFSIATDKTKGLTTDIFTFKVIAKDTVPTGERIHARWDWNNDSVFDTKYSDNLEETHRFYKPGKYSITCETLSLSGGKDFQTLQVEISQGYSAPIALFIAVPQTGHFKTNILFDASESYDDEDSTETLKYRWDFDDDGIWDTPFLDEPTIHHQFEVMMDYTVNLNVIDPTNRSGYLSRIIRLHRTDTCIVPDFTWFSEYNRAGKPFIFDASSTYHKTDPEKELKYKWLFPNQEYTDLSKDSIIEHIFKSPGKKLVVLTVADEDGLQNSVEKELTILIENKPPNPKIITPIRYGNLETKFYLDASQSLDDKTPTSELLLRWDFDGDGSWDTNKSSDKEYYHQYASSGTFKCILEAEDEEGLTDTTSYYFVVSPYYNPTGFIKDNRDGLLYGTVNIGNQWWMAENLNFQPDPKHQNSFFHICYNNMTENCDKYGSLYLIERIFDYNRIGKNVCPEGWRLPTKQEYEVLLDEIGYNESARSLLTKGSSTYNALYSGYATYKFIYEEDYPYNIKDTIYHFYNIDEEAYFLTSDLHPSSVFNAVWTLQLGIGIPEAYIGFYPRDRYYSVRCIKNE